MNGRKLRGTQRITLAAMTISLTLVCIYLGSIIPTGRLGFLFLASVFVAALMVERETMLAVLAFIGASLLGFLLVANKLFVLPYALFFGHYGIAKEYIERIKDRILRWAVKLLYFNVPLVLTWLLAYDLFFAGINFGFPVYWLILPAQAVFIVYDWLYTRVVHFYIDRFRRFIVH
jgi:hypothetical protein